ncbi:golgin subfamily A member 1-like [Biomphalaria glabrata]|uniref:Golgin subfamily A member 1-like n=1 Tax=Biomphalaria glabrata TaxID=6526 RepID=A0A9W3BHD2_BIOGL|nr:golgin subfamily A member 1-like [Biomphalaria glabrata]
MFAKLKKKIETEAGTILSPETQGKTSLGRRDSISSLPRAGSIQHLGPSPPGSITSEDLSIRDVSNFRDELAVLLQKKSEQCKKLEGNISDLAALVKEKTKTIEKLESSIKQQEEVTNKKLQEQKEEFEVYRDKLIEGYQTDKLKLDKDKTELLEKLADAEKFRALYFKREEESDEFEGLATQELSKIKHLLLNTEEALNACRNELETKSRQCHAAETQVERLTDELAPLKQKLAILEADNMKLKEETAERAELVISLSKDKSAFDKRLDELNKEMLEKQNQLSKLQEQYSDMDGEYKTFLRNSDLQRNKTSKLLEEKEDKIDGLLERVKVLEQRLADSGLSGDERTSALNAERESLEKKLEEARQQLTEVKSTWSDKISQLEHQISNLNAKIVEDSEDLANNQKFTEQMRTSYNKQIEDLHAKLEDAENRALENLELTSSKSFHYEKQIDGLETELNKQKLLVSTLQENITELETQKLKRNEESEKTISDLKQQIVELKNKETNLLDEVQNLKNEIDKLLKDSSDKDLHIQSLLDQIQQKENDFILQNHSNSNLQEQLVTLGNDVDRLQLDKQELKTNLTTAENEKEKLLERTADLLKERENLQSINSNLKSEYERALEMKSQTIESLQRTEAGLRQKLDSLERQIEQSELSKAESGLYSSRIDEMSEMISSLQNQLADKNRTVKKQEQTIKDLRTTLQRELKVQTVPSEDGLDQTTNNTVTSSPAIARKYDSYQQQHSQQNQAGVTSSSRTATNPAPAVLSLQTSSSNMVTVTSSSSSVPGSPHDAMLAHSTIVKRELDKDVNFLYLKHVVLKFMLSRESEAIQLIKAVSMLLNFSHQEQQLIKETLEWKMSWFGHRPPLGKGQTSKVIPPTL